MKKPILYIVLLLSTNFLFAQGSLTFNPYVPNVTNGIVDFTFDLVGGGAEYDLSVEVSFNNGSDWNDIDPSYLTGQLEGVVPASGIALQWDAMASFPGQVSNETILRVTARHVCGTAFTFTYPAAGTATVTYGTISKTYNEGTVDEFTLCWFDRNLGASQVATSSADDLAYGDLFQWGRGDDGHQVRNPLSMTTSTLSTTDDPGHGNFITVGSLPWDWRDGQNDNLWQGVDGINNPCPPGWRVPTNDELEADRQSWGSNSSGWAFVSTLKWTGGGFRSLFGAVDNLGQGFVWSSSVSGADASHLYFHSTGASMDSWPRGAGLSVRCVRDIVRTEDE